MSTDRDVARCLSSIRELSAALAAELVSLRPAAWDGPTNCPPWRVRDLVAHVVVSGEGFAASVRQGLAGSVEPSITSEARARRQTEIETAGPRNAARALQAVTDDFAALYAGLADDQLATICFHRRGNRSVRWYAAHRLAEVAFHWWDVQVSLGHEPELNEQVAALLLPTLLESNAPRTYAVGLTPRRGSGERYLLAVADDPLARWLVTIEPDRLEARRADAPADLTVTGSAAALALLAYGRFELPALMQSGALRVAGDLTLTDRFALIFPRP
ncbi:MAG TPA: maleylpyruvate isomerase N-terminal domain-containing protein [Chloroflexota bacterium]|nr:maleylpyruvate isomerase N-terminal domain-containing protein [Chloroflexota bacterium]